MSTKSAAAGVLNDRAIRRPHLTPVVAAPLAEVRSIDTAPSARRRQRVLLADAPSMSRRPLMPRTSAPSISASPLKILGSLAALVALAGVGAGVGLAISPAPYDGPVVIHSVIAGESVWSIAQSVKSDRPLEEVVSDIERLNADAGVLTAGELITVPVH